MKLIRNNSKSFASNKSEFKTILKTCLGESVFLLELQILVVESVNSINHGLDQFNFRVAQAVLIGNVIGDAGLAARLTTGSSGLQVQAFAPLLQWWDTLLGPSGQVNMNWSPHARAKIGGTGVEETKTGVKHEFAAGFGLDRVTDGLDASDKSVKDTADITAWKKENFFNGIEEKKNLSPGLVVMGGHSCSEGRGFESCCCILDGHNIFDMYLL